MQIVGLQAENVKKLKLVSVKFDPKRPVITISGANEQGKSTFLDCFEYALSGAKSLKDVSMPIRAGEDHAKIVVETDELTVTRTWTATGHTYLKVENKDGWEPKGGAQALLDRLYSAFSFDPLAFSMMKDKDQLDTLLKLVNIPLDLTKWAADRKKIFDARTDINRTVSDLDGQLKLMADVPENTPDEEVPAASVLEEQAEAQRIINKNNEKRRDLEDANRKKLDAASAFFTEQGRLLEEKTYAAEYAETSIVEMKRSIAELENRLQAAKDGLSTQQDRWKKAVADLAEQQKINNNLQNPDTLEFPGPETLGLVDPDMTVFAEKIKNLEDANRLVRVKKKKAELKVQHFSSTVESEVYTDRLGSMDKEKADALKAAKFPIEGMSFNETGILYKGIPFSQCSSAERLRVSTAMGMAMNPKLKAMFIRDASLLDSKNKAMIEKLAEENGFVVFMEVADDTGKLGIFIEDGMVTAIDGKVVEKEVVNG